MVFWRESLLVEFSPLMRIYPLWQHYISMTSQPWANPVRRVTSNFCPCLSLSHSLSRCLSLELLSKHILLLYRLSLTLFLYNSLFPILPLILAHSLYSAHISWCTITLSLYSLSSSLPASAGHLFCCVEISEHDVMEVRDVNGLRQCDAACVDTLIHIKQLQTFSQQAPSKQTSFLNGLLIDLFIFILLDN